MNQKQPNSLTAKAFQLYQEKQEKWDDEREALSPVKERQYACGDSDAKTSKMESSAPRSQQHRLFAFSDNLEDVKKRQMDAWHEKQMSKTCCVAVAPKGRWKAVVNDDVDNKRYSGAANAVYNESRMHARKLSPTELQVDVETTSEDVKRIYEKANSPVMHHLQGGFPKVPPPLQFSAKQAPPFKQEKAAAKPTLQDAIELVRNFCGKGGTEHQQFATAKRLHTLALKDFYSKSEDPRASNNRTRLENLEKRLDALEKALFESELEKESGLEAASWRAFQ